MDIIRNLEEANRKRELSPFQIGDVVDVHVRIREGEKQRIQIFSGTVIKIKGGRGLRGSFTVRRIVQGEGVERIFPFHCPSVQDVKVKRPGKVRRAKLYYLRDRVGKATKVKERRVIEERSSKPKKSRKARKSAKSAKSEPDASVAKSTAAEAAEPVA